MTRGQVDAFEVHPHEGIPFGVFRVVQRFGGMGQASVVVDRIEPAKMLLGYFE